MTSSVETYRIASLRWKKEKTVGGWDILSASTMVGNFTIHFPHEGQDRFVVSFFGEHDTTYSSLAVAKQTISVRHRKALLRFLVPIASKVAT